MNLVQLNLFFRGIEDKLSPAIKYFLSFINKQTTLT